MSIFSRKTEQPVYEEEQPVVQEVAAPAPEPVKKVEEKPAFDPRVTVISRGTEFKGDIMTEDGVKIYGNVTGNISCGSMTVFEGGEYFGDAQAKEIDIRGTSNGNLVCTGRTSVSSTGVILGSLQSSDLATVEGATIKGQIGLCKVAPEVKAAPAAPVYEEPVKEEPKVFDFSFEEEPGKNLMQEGDVAVSESDIFGNL